MIVRGRRILNKERGQKEEGGEEKKGGGGGAPLS